MSLPGFGAESSLYKNRGYYPMAEGFGQVHGVTPQFLAPGCVRVCHIGSGWEDCQICCLKNGRWKCEFVDV